MDLKCIMKCGVNLFAEWVEYGYMDESCIFANDNSINGQCELERVAIFHYINGYTQRLFVQKLRKNELIQNSPGMRIESAC